MKSLILTASVLGLVACSTPVKHNTLRDIDFSGKRQVSTGVTAAPKTPDDIRKAYLEYLKHATKDDKSRVDALHRLAKLEFDLSEARNKAAHSDATAITHGEIYNASLDRSIELYQTLLSDHPTAENTDRPLYH